MYILYLSIHLFESQVEHSAVISLFILLIKFPLILIKFHCETTSVASDRDSYVANEQNQKQPKDTHKDEVRVGVGIAAKAQVGMAGVGVARVGVRDRVGEDDKLIKSSP